jgi:hypothetical protein
MDSGIIGLLGVVVGTVLGLAIDAVRRHWQLKDQGAADRRQVYARYLQGMSALTTHWVMHRTKTDAFPWWAAILVPPQEPEDLGPVIVQLGEKVAELQLVAPDEVHDAAAAWTRFMGDAVKAGTVPSREEATRLRLAFVNAAREDLGIKHLTYKGAGHDKQ